MSIGEYETPSASLTQWRARAAFLNLLPKLAPRAVKELAGTLLRSFQMAETDCFRFINEWDSIKVCSDGNARGDARYVGIYSAAQVKFYQELTAWASKHHLNARWLIEAVILLLDWWIEFPKEVGKKLATGLDYSETWFGEEEPFRFEYPEWNYHEQSENEYRQAVREDFRKELNLYLKNRSSQAVASGDQSVKRMRKRGEIKPTIKMQWFVLYQVKGLTPEQILDRYTRSLPESAFPDQVMKAVREVSSLIGLQYRQVPRGRPKKQR
jgi:hypothetical protein